MRKLLYHCVAILILAFPTQSRAVPFDTIYVLGDSLSDQGNLLTATGLIPFAPLLPDPEHYFNGRFSNGPNYVDVLSQQLGVSSGHSFLGGGNNFAFGGARTTYNSAENFFPSGIFPWSLNDEIAAFSDRGVHDPNALYIVFSGANDITDIIDLGLNPGVVFPTLLNGIQNAIAVFQLAGAQTIVVPNIPDLGLIPAYLSNPAVAAIATSLSQQYNELLHQELAAITNLNIVEFDTFGWMRAAVANPAAFGLTNVTDPCYSGFVFPDPDATECANPDAYLFWDIEHPTRAAHALLAREILAGTAEAVPVPEPSTLSLLSMVVIYFGMSRFTQRKKRT